MTTERDEYICTGCWTGYPTQQQAESCTASHSQNNDQQQEDEK